MYTILTWYALDCESALLFPSMSVSLIVPFRPSPQIFSCSQKHQTYSRAYVDFKRPEDVIEFAEFFDGHVFVNEKGKAQEQLQELSWA